MNGWRGLLFEGPQTSIKVTGAVIEGYKPGGVDQGAGPGRWHACRPAPRQRRPGTTSTSGRRWPTPPATKAGYYQIDDGEAVLHRDDVVRGELRQHDAHIDHLRACRRARRQMKRNNEGHPGRPRYRSEFDTNERQQLVLLP